MEPNLFHRSANAGNGLFAAVLHTQNTRHYSCSALEYPLPQANSVPRTSFQIAARDICSPLQFTADTAFIIALGILTGAAYDLLAFGSAAGQIRDFAFTGLVVALLFAIASRLSPDTRVAKLTSGYDRLRDVALHWTLAFTGLVFVFFALKAGASVSRGAVLSFYMGGLPAVALWRVFSPVALAPVARKVRRQCIVIGDSADPLLEKLAAEVRSKGQIVPAILKFRASCLPALWPQELRHLASRVANAARELGPGEIFLCAGSVPSDRLTAVGRILSIIPRAIYVVPDAQTASLVRCKPSILGSYIALEIRREPLGLVQRTVKRLMDIAVATFLLVFFAPLFLFVAITIKLDSCGPVFFKQTRNGYQGKPFRIWKFRSMCVQEDGSTIVQARRGDSRITRVGRFLRKSSIDELPQLINILFGEMSLVGPRPHARAHDELYARSIENYEVRQHVKPGLTGWAQVNGLRGETATLDAMYRRIEFDLWYAVNASVLLDIEILVRTVIEVCRHRNAY